MSLWSYTTIYNAKQLRLKHTRPDNTKRKSPVFSGLSYTYLDFIGLAIGTSLRTRTGMPLRAADFESAVSTIPPDWQIFVTIRNNHTVVKRSYTRTAWSAA